MFCFECGFKLVDGSKFCSSCGTPQVKSAETFEVHLTVYSESWTEEMEGDEDDEGSLAEVIQRGDDGWESFLTFAEGSDHRIESTPFDGTDVNPDKAGAPQIGWGDHCLDFVSSTFDEGLWYFNVRYEVDVVLQITASSAELVREICETQIKARFALWASAFGDFFPIDAIRIDQILDEAAAAEKKAEWAKAMAKGQS
jgi:zinc-ribbon domain